MESIRKDVLSFYKNKKILITGHTGFKGSWLSKIMVKAGAKVVGYGLPPVEVPNLFELCKLDSSIKSVMGDIRDLELLNSVFLEEEPEIVIHLAAQPLVRESYLDPVTTYSTNVMGTVNICECVRNSSSVKSFLNVTTDKVYKNNEWEWGYRESERLDGYDPYSNSKSCSELVTQSYIRAYFSEMRLPVSTARAGNVIGGGDFAQNRIIPDCVRAMTKKEDIIVRNPNSIRPYQHVLEPLNAYLEILKEQYFNYEYAGHYNVGPNEEDCLGTGDMVDLFCKYWGGDASWKAQGDEGPHEANFLKLDCSKLKSKFGWKPIWDVECAVEKTVEWYRRFVSDDNYEACMNEQIESFFRKKERTDV